MKTNPKHLLWPKAILAVTLLICLLDMPYGYYQLVRLLGMVMFAVLAYSERQKNQIWFIVWISSALLINPIFKISLGREIWNIIDVIWAVLLVGSIRANEK